MYIILWALGLIAYAAVGATVAYLTGEDVFFFVWPLPVAIVILATPVLLGFWLNDKIRQRIEKVKKAKKPIDPIETVQGLIATKLLMHPEKWDSMVWRHKNVVIKKVQSSYHSNLEPIFEISMGKASIPGNEELKNAIIASLELKRAFLANKQEAERKKLILNELEEFMKS